MRFILNAKGLRDIINFAMVDEPDYIEIELHESEKRDKSRIELHLWRQERTDTGYPKSGRYEHNERIVYVDKHLGEKLKLPSIYQEERA